MKKIQEIKDSFKNKKLFETALTHKSWVNENKNIRTSNERLEFLGDAVLEFVVTDKLYKKFPDDEGVLTQIRANIVNTMNLANASRILGIDEIIYFSKGETTSGRKSNSILADTFEAIIGAIYIDRGIKKAEEFINEELLKDLDKKLREPLKDGKSLLQEKLQAGKHKFSYKVAKITGPDHARVFTVQILIDGKIAGEGEGKSKNEAEQKAAKVALATGIA